MLALSGIHNRTDIGQYNNVVFTLSAHFPVVFSIHLIVLPTIDFYMSRGVAKYMGATYQLKDNYFESLNFSNESK